MNKKSNEAKQNIFEGLGHFIIEFEQLVLSMKITIYTILGRTGLKEIDYARILLADQSAYPVLQKLRSLLAIQYKSSVDELKHLDGLFAFTVEIIQYRNFVLHGSWFLDNSATEHINAEVIKDKTFKNGIEGESRNLTLADVDALTKKITLAKRLYDTLTLCIFEPHRNLKEKIRPESIMKLKID